MHMMLLPTSSPPSLLLSECTSSLLGSQTMQPASRSGMLRLGRGLRDCEVGDWKGEGVVGGERGVEELVLRRVRGIGGEVWRGEGVEGKS